MHKKSLFGLLILVLIILPLLTACPAETTPTPTAGTPTPTAGPPTATPEAHWWDKFGEPQYGGDITFASARYSENFDPYNTGYSAHYYFLETLVIPDWALDREIWPFKTPFIPMEYYQPHVAESWEIPDLQTMIIHVRPGIHFHDKAPVNGRELNAYDLEWHYDRFLGTGSGFTEPSAMDYARIKVIEKCTATDEYTAVITFTEPSVLNAELITAQDGYNSIEPREVIEQYGDMSDWRNAVGTGPWIVDDVIATSSIKFVRNPDYWGYDERHPDNKLPYADSLTVVNIPDVSTRLAALRFTSLTNWAGSRRPTWRKATRNCSRPSCSSSAVTAWP
jgi:ABC-type transport system substrate-binding protein